MSTAAPIRLRDSRDTVIYPEVPSIGGGTNKLIMQDGPLPDKLSLRCDQLRQELRRLYDNGAKDADGVVKLTANYDPNTGHIQYFRPHITENASRGTIDGKTYSIGLDVVKRGDRLALVETQDLVENMKVNAPFRQEINRLAHLVKPKKA